ncbi:MAG: Smr/MutS family protein [Pseudomonadota bacterium]
MAKKRSKRTSRSLRADPPATDADRGLWDRVKRTVDPLDAGQRARYSQALADYLEQEPPSQGPPSQRPSSQGPSIQVAGGTLNGGAGTPKPIQPADAAPTVQKLANKSGSASRQRAPSPGGTGTTSMQVPERQPLVALDRKTRQRITRGRTPIDARLDLHGYRQHEARDILQSFIFRSHARGHRTVLVITGKGSRKRALRPHDPPWAVGSGILRQAVPSWLAAPDLRFAVLSVEQAHAAHGGEGALYVRLRAKTSGDRQNASPRT